MENLEPLIEVQEQQIYNKQLELYELNVKLCKLDQIINKLKVSINASIRANNYSRANYYKYLLKSKSSCISKYAKVKSTKLKELDELSNKLCNLKAKYECDNGLLKDFEVNTTMMNYLQNKLDKLQADVAKIENQRFLFERHQDKLGIKGDHYIKFLFHLRYIARAIQLGCNAYASIISSLNGNRL